jgi:hypothetical protein
MRNDAVSLAADPMFDSGYYRSRHMHKAARWVSPALHYLLYGRFASLAAHPLFDGDWYRDAYRDVGSDDADPLLHYIRHGRAEGRRPNAYFDPGWYLRRNPDLKLGVQDAFQHFIAHGSAEGRDPSARFSMKTYLAQNPELAAASVNPLAHYLSRVDRERLAISAYEVDFSDARPVEEAVIETRKRPIPRSESALFVTHSADGHLKAHVAHYLKSLSQEGIGVTLIVAADNGFIDDRPWLYELIDGLYVRDNVGWDFAAWAHVMRLNPEFFEVDRLYWLNDSLVGPFSRQSFHKLISRVRDDPANLVGLTFNRERADHIQSYFLAFRSGLLSSKAFYEFIYFIKSFQDKEDVINAYEIKLYPYVLSCGMSASALFDLGKKANSTLLDWEDLIERGFCFLKVLAIRNELSGSGDKRWRKILEDQGYDVALVDRLLEQLNESPQSSP